MALGLGTVDAFSGAVKDIFSGIGEKQSADSYRRAAEISGENAGYAAEGAAIRTYQVDRKSFQTISGQQADVAAAGFANSGSALDLLRDSTAQGHLSSAASQIQGEMDVNTYKQSQVAYEGEAQAADTAATGDFIGSAMKLVGGVASFFL